MRGVFCILGIALVFAVIFYMDYKVNRKEKK